jgi:hypothetical protein
MGYDSKLRYRGTRTKRTAQEAGYVAGAVSPVSECESYRNNQTEAKRELLTEGTDECHYLVG